MPEENLQQDLFEGKYYEKKVRKTPILGNYPGPRVLPHVKIPAEYAIVIAIGILVSIIVAYAIGVEVGKNSIPKGTIAETSSSKGVATDTVIVEDMLIDTSYTPPVVVDDPEPDPMSEIDKVPEVKEIVPEPVPVKPEVSSEPAPDSAYIIIIASVKSKGDADKGADKLKGEGLDARVRKKGSWYQIYASGYDTISQAKKARKALSSRYKDCYIRKLK